jgi:hypothetical protein
MNNKCEAISEKIRTEDYRACCPFLCNGGKKCLHIPLHEWSEPLVTKIMENFIIKSDGIKLHSDVAKLEKCKSSKAYKKNRIKCDGRGGSAKQPFYGCLKTKKMYKYGPTINKYMLCECHHNQLLEIIKRSVKNGSILGASKLLLIASGSKFDPGGALSKYN